MGGACLSMGGVKKEPGYWMSLNFIRLKIFEMSCKLEISFILNVVIFVVEKFIDPFSYFAIKTSYIYLYFNAVKR